MKQTMAGEKILVVDDEAPILLMVDRVLTKEGYVVKSALSSQDALEIVRKERFDLIIVDMVMPSIDGLKLMRMVRRTYPDIGTIMISGYATLDLAISSLRQGVQGFLVKPFTGQELRVEVKRVLKRDALHKGKENENRSAEE